jgi:hypothetical protein
MSTSNKITKLAKFFNHEPDFESIAGSLVGLLNPTPGFSPFSSDGDSDGFSLRVHTAGDFDLTRDEEPKRVSFLSAIRRFIKEDAESKDLAVAIREIEKALTVIRRAKRRAELAESGSIANPP